MSRQRPANYMRDYMRRYRADGRFLSHLDTPGKQAYWRNQHERLRRKAMDALGGQHCAECGCDEYRVLEINHINGGGSRDQKATQVRALYRDIVANRVERSGFNVLCRVCNALHYVRDLLGVNGHAVIWRQRQESNPLAPKRPGFQDRRRAITTPLP